MISLRHEELELQAARDQWRRLASMQGMLCISCLEVPSLEHRHAFYDTGLCEECCRSLAEGEAGTA
jgi:hypothetical protein